MGRWEALVVSVGLAFALLILAVGIGIFGVSVFGLVLAFKASIILGLIALLTFKLLFPFVLAVCYFCGVDAAQKITDWANFPI